MGKIKLLDDLTIQKIAAGEIIERPASIVKELVENSIDANAKNITIEISQGGKSFIRVTDDGDGIEEGDLELAFKRHSTSKLSSIDDIYSLMSLGFRGEALASISNVSRVEVLTKTNTSKAGIQANLEEGEIISKDIVGCPKGTTMIIRDLFYNLPVRKKFLKSDLAEGNQISDIVYKLALGNYDRSFKFIRDGKIVLKTSGSNDIKENIYTILGKDVARNIIPISYEENNLKISGYISNNHLYRSNRSHQYLYINGRYIVNYGLTLAIENQYKSLIPLNRYPVYIIYVEVNPKDIDVNIHPTKQEIKFINNTDIYKIMSDIIDKSLNPSLQIPKIELDDKNKKNNEVEEITLFIQEPSIDSFSDISTDVIIRDLTNDNLEKGLKNVDISENNVHLMYDYTNTNQNYEDTTIIDSNLESKPEINNILSTITPIGTVFETYILAEDKEKNKLYFIDQHAAHERIMYEKYKREYEKDQIITQQLLIPEIIDLTNKEMMDVMNNLSLFEKLGFDIEEFGTNSIAIRGAPMIFGKPNIKDLFIDLIDNLTHDIKSSYDTRVDKIMKLACSKAIKSGDRISNIEIKALFNELLLCESPYTCPHGRPTIIEMTKRDIEKYFLRII